MDVTTESRYASGGLRRAYDSTRHQERGGSSYDVVRITNVKMYPYNVNGVRLSTGTEVMSAKELIKKAVAADALVTTPRPTSS